VALDESHVSMSFRQSEVTMLATAEVFAKALERAAAVTITGAIRDPFCLPPWRASVTTKSKYSRVMRADPLGDSRNDSWGVAVILTSAKSRGSGSERNALRPSQQEGSPKQ
jgi:hypothetical protein